MKRDKSSDEKPADSGQVEAVVRRMFPVENSRALKSGDSFCQQQK